MSHNIKAGVATGREVQEIFKLAKEKGFALPAVNVVGSNTINGVLETARDLNAPVIIQFSNGGACFNAGKGLSNDNQKAAVAGAVAGGIVVANAVFYNLKLSIAGNGGGAGAYIAIPVVFKLKDYFRIPAEITELLAKLAVQHIVLCLQVYFVGFFPAVYVKCGG